MIIKHGFLKEKVIYSIFLKMTYVSIHSNSINIKTSTDEKNQNDIGFLQK